MRAVLVACALAACGDNALPDGVPLTPARDLAIVAHQDDDLLFMQPDLVEAVRAGDGVTTVYVTAGNSTHGADFAQQRYAGLREAYFAAAGKGAWVCGWIDLAGHVAEHCRLDAAKVSLVFLAYPDGIQEGQSPTSLLHLWQGDISGATTVADRTAHYTRDDLIETLAEIERETQPATIRTLEVAATHGDDHSDHMLVGALAVLATSRAQSRAELISYRGYDVDDEQVNKNDAIFNETLPVLEHYEACATGCAPCGQACTTIDPLHVMYLHHRYAVGFRKRIAGQLAYGSGCVTAAIDGSVALDDCAAAQTWLLDADGELRSDDLCLAAQPDGSLRAGDCIGGDDHTFFIDDEHHVWSGVPPTPQADMSKAHLDCLGDGARLSLCGADYAPTWDILTPVHVTLRTTLGLTATGRALQLADVNGDGKADLCSITPSGLFCAPGVGDGTFRAALEVDNMDAPLTADPRSLVIGDVDNDGVRDACGRNAQGITCMLSSTSFLAVPWATVFGVTDATPGTAASLAAIDANDDTHDEICGVAAEGVLCISRGMETPPKARTTFPDPAGTVWIGELDGDGYADWCTQTQAGPACGTQAQANRTTDGSPWAFSVGGTVQASPAATADTAGLADVDGDGRADLCELEGDRVMCARSQSRGFGPRATLATIQDATALWLGDLDGDGKADACVDTGVAVSCALSP